MTITAHHTPTRHDRQALRRFIALMSFLALPVLLYAAWVVWPTVQTFYLSLTRWDGYGPPRFTGLGNYLELLGDRNFHQALFNNAVWMLVFISVPLAGGLALALVLGQRVRFAGFLKVSFYFPMVLAPLVSALIWTWIYLPDGGLINALIFRVLSVLKALGAAVTPNDAYLNPWLGAPGTALACVLLTALWRQVGYVMMLYLAGLTSLDTEVLEAARVDGAEGWTLFRHVTFPLLAPFTTIVVIISIVDSLRAFDLVNVMTKGGPAGATEVLANYMYTKAFDENRMGYGAAVAVVLFAISAVFIFLYLRQILAQEDREDT